MKTFTCDESMIITIPIGSLKDIRDGQLMPDKFYCVYKDYYKVFSVRGKPKPVGVAQAITGLFILTLGLIITQTDPIALLCTQPSVLFVVSGMLCYAAGQSPNMHVAKLSFSVNILSVFWSTAAIYLCISSFSNPAHAELHDGIMGLILTLLITEMLMAIFLIYWLSKAICRQHFNTLPIILLKQGG